ncbi:MAG: hypothetical protein ACXWJ1_14315, partial [Caldimonas sp.]
MNVVIDRIEITLDGVADDDSRLLAAELPAALENRLGRAEASGAATPYEGPLATALRGRALVEAVVARLADAIAAETRRRADARAEGASAD